MARKVRLPTYGLTTRFLLELRSYVPYKYDLNKFTIAGNLNKDHSDPSVFCVLMAKSKMPGRSLTEFCVVGPRWDVAEGTFRPPVSPTVSRLVTDRKLNEYEVLPPQHCRRTTRCCHGRAFCSWLRTRRNEL